MNSQFKTVGFWVTLTNMLVGIAVAMFGVTSEQGNAVTTMIGSLMVLLSQLGYVHAEAQVRIARIKSATIAYAGMNGASVMAHVNRI